MADKNLPQHPSARLRPLLLAFVAVFGLGALALLGLDELGGREQVAAIATSLTTLGATAPPIVSAPPAPPTVPESSAPPPASPPAADAGKAEDMRPSFDVVRVSPSGDGVFAGRAAPHAEVTIRDAERVLGTVVADANGQWVLIPTEKLPPGAQELTLHARAQDGQDSPGSSAVALMVPNRADAPPSAGMPDAPVALLTPNTGGSQLLQAPPASSPGPATPDSPATALPATGAPTIGAMAAASAPGVAPLAATPIAIPASATQLGVAVSGGIMALPTRLALDLVDYDDEGGIRFAGSAPPGIRLRVYVDNRAAGDAIANTIGHWALVPTLSVALGQHKLRVDQLGATGNVAARVELPFQRVTLPPQSVGDGHIVVQPGNNLWRLARRAYGSGIRYTVIYQANRDQIRDPRHIYPGQIFAIPAAITASGTDTQTAAPRPQRQAADSTTSPSIRSK